MIQKIKFCIFAVGLTSQISLATTNSEPPKGQDPCLQLFAETNLPSGLLSLETQYAKLHVMTDSKLTARVHQLYQLARQFIEFGADRRYQSSAVNSSIEVVTLRGGFTDIKVTDVIDDLKRPLIIQSLRDAGIQPEMWVSRVGERVPTHNYFGRYSTIVEYEYALSTILRYLIDKKNDDRNGFNLAAILDRLIRKHQLYMGLAPELQVALDHDFTLAGFNSFEGPILPNHYPVGSFVGQQMITSIRLQRDKDGKTDRERLVVQLERWKNILHFVQESKTVPVELRPLDVTDLTVDKAKSHITTLTELLSLPEIKEGIVEGVIDRVYPAGFDIIQSDGTKLVLNTNYGVIFNGGIAIRSPK